MLLGLRSIFDAIDLSQWTAALSMALFTGLLMYILLWGVEQELDGLINSREEE